MALSALTQPDEFMAAYSAVPVKLFDNNVFISENYKYLINLCFDKFEITSAVAYPLYGEVFTECTSLTNHNYALGDYLFLDDTANSNLYTGYYIIKKITASNKFVIDLTPAQPFGVNNFFTSKFIKYKMNPDLDGNARLDMSNVLKDFVSQNLTGQSVNYGLHFPGPDTRFCYELNCGNESNYVLRFDDNLFSGGSLCFIATGITSLTNIPFQIGDTIQVEQDLYGWNYLDNYFSGGYVAFTGATQVPFPLGATINVQGQITHPFYNGYSTLNAIPQPNLLQIDKSWIASSPVEPGVIYGVPKPEYNGVCNIVNIFIDPILGYLVIITDKSFSGASPVLPGSIQFADNRLTINPNEISITGKCVFNAHLNLNEYTITEYDKYVIQDRNANLNYISTILNQNQRYRVEPSTIGWALLHFDTGLSGSPTTNFGYTFYDSNNTMLGNVLVVNNEDDVYAPIGLNQISNLTFSNQFGVPFTGYSGNVDNYCLFAADDCGCSCLTGQIVFKPGQGTNHSVNLTSSGQLNGRDYWDFVISANTGNINARLWWVNDGISFKWYITDDTATTYTPFYAYDKDYNTDCPGDTLEWSVPIPSPLLGGFTGTLFSANPSGAIVQYSNEICFELNKDCSMYEIYHIMWKDKLGSWISYPFIYVSRDNMEAETKTYYKQNGNWENNSFGYDDYGRGETNFFLRSRKSILVNSGWLYEFERDLMEDLIQSPFVYIQTPDNRLYGGKLEEKKIEIYKRINEDLFSYSFNVILANNEYRF